MRRGCGADLLLGARRELASYVATSSYVQSPCTYVRTHTRTYVRAYEARTSSCEGSYVGATSLYKLVQASTCTSACTSSRTIHLYEYK